MTERLTKEQAMIVMAYTGYTTVNFGDFQGYAEALLGRPIWTHEFASKSVEAELREASKEAFLAILPLDESTESA